MNLLIVDDEMIAIKAILDGVKWEHMDIDKIYTANSAVQARKILTKDKIDILLCDIEMTPEDGISLVRWIREYYNSIECIFITCHADFNFAREAIKLNSFDYLLKPVSYDKLEEILHKVIDKIHDKMNQSKVMQYGEIYLKEFTGNAECKESVKKTVAEIVDEVSKYIRFHLSETLTVEEIAGQIYLNPDYLTRIFRKETGEPLIKFIIRERMYMAAKLLTDTQLSVNSIALEVGYSDYSHFTKMFKQIYGITPTVYRQKHK